MSGLKFRGRPPIKIAGSVKDVITLRNPYAQDIVDRGTGLTEEIYQAILAQSIFSWEGRNPAPALDLDGNFQGTDLDLLSFLVPMAEYRAVIEIPHYRNRRKVVRKANERKIGTNQFGPINALISNQKVFSFSVRIIDNTIVRLSATTGRETLGAWRNYMIVDCDGHWYDGWDRIVFNPIAEENSFLSEKGLWTGNAVYFTNYVHPNRWQSVFGAPHLLQKILIERLDDEAHFYREEMKRLEAMGIHMPSGDREAYVPAVSEGATEKIEVATMEMSVVTNALHGAYPSVANTQQGLIQAYNRQKKLTYSEKPRVQFVTRANEAAYFQYGLGDVAHWMGGRLWISIKEKRTEWNQMVLSNDCALRYRTKKVSEHVSAE